MNENEVPPANESGQLHEYLNSLGNYGESGSLQPSDEALFDSQIKNFSLLISSIVGQNKEGAIIDIGCGEGILLKRLIDIQSFKDNIGWIYFGIDHEEKLDGVYSLARSLRINRRVEMLTIGEFYSEWPDKVSTPKPYIGVIRNVLHELDIDQTSEMFHRLTTYFGPKDTLLLQDLEVFPVGERGNVCWMIDGLNSLLTTIGFSAQFVEEPSRKGNLWFTFSAVRTSSPTMGEQELRKVVLSERKKQFDSWIEQGCFGNKYEHLRNVYLSRIDFDLQCNALHKQLIESQSDIVQPFTAKEESEIFQKAFTKILRSFNPDLLAKSIRPIERPQFFRDRGDHQNWLEEFLREDSKVALISAGSYYGKTILIQEVLSGRAYNKNAVTIDVNYTSTVWNLVEQYLTSLEVKMSFEAISGLSNISFNDIVDEFTKFASGCSSMVIVAIDHFERLLNPFGALQDEEIKTFLGIIANAPGSKLIITSRRRPLVDFIDPTMLWKEAPPFGRFPEGMHIENLLDDYVDRKALNIEKYPDSLMQAIDRHPYLGMLAGRIINKEGKSAILDQGFIQMVRDRLREELLDRIVDDSSRPAIEFMSFLRIPVPRRMVESLVSKSGLQAAYEAGLVYDVYDRSYSDLISILGPFRKFKSESDEFESQNAMNEAFIEERLTHNKIKVWYQRLYRESSDPRWIREMYYHTMASGDKLSLKYFGGLYKSEIFWVGYYWFRVLKQFDQAYWAYKTAHDLGLRSEFTEMRMAACMMRLKEPGKDKEGEKIYSDLIRRFPNERRYKTSYIDSLLFIGRFGKALRKLKEFNLTMDDDAWVIHEYGRAFFGLHRYGKAVEAFLKQLTFQDDPYVYDILARLYYRLGMTEKAGAILTKGRRLYSGNKHLKLTYASHLIRLGDPDSRRIALDLIQSLYSRYPDNGRIILQYSKLLINEGNVDEAERLWEDAKHVIFPIAYKTPIFTNILICRGKWESALRQLENIPLDDEYLVSLKMRVFLTWANSKGNAKERSDIAKKGLEIPIEREFENNVPIMINRAKMARIAGNSKIFKKARAKIKQMNPDVENAILEDITTPYWEEDYVPRRPYSE
jgi:tetratricopeptide (TPR) repeat protein